MLSTVPLRPPLVDKDVAQGLLTLHSKFWQRLVSGLPSQSCQEAKKDQQCAQVEVGPREAACSIRSQRQTQGHSSGEGAGNLPKGGESIYACGRLEQSVKVPPACRLSG